MISIMIGSLHRINFGIFRNTQSPSKKVLRWQGMRCEFESAGAGASWRALGLKTAGAHSTRSLKISGCKR